MKMNRGYFARKFIDPKPKYNFYEETSIWMRKKRKHRTLNGPQIIDIVYKAIVDASVKSFVPLPIADSTKSIINESDSFFVYVMC